MPTRKPLATIVACVTLAGPAMADPLTDALAGKTLVNDSSEIKVNADGSLIGTAGGAALEGTWSVENGQWCRTLTAPARAAGSACQAATLNADGTITFDGVRGPVTYAIR
jgi:hypothetical protein